MNILVSACLLGVPCRYDGNAKNYDDIDILIKNANLIPVCPEQLGGLATPRPPCEIKDGHVFTNDKKDVTESYNKGAESVLFLAKKFCCKYALLKERSPSCGSGIIHDGSFSGALTNGDGITAALLKKNGIKVYGESECNKLLAEISNVK